jgi:hypothetical protein
MRFGERCQTVELQGGSQTSGSVGEEAIAALNAELARLEEAIKAAETWHTERIVRRDADGSEEVLHKTVLVGAEGLRTQFEQLLDTRRALLGQRSEPAVSAAAAASGEGQVL